MGDIFDELASNPPSQADSPPNDIFDAVVEDQQTATSASGGDIFDQIAEQQSAATPDQSLEVGSTRNRDVEGAPDFVAAIQQARDEHAADTNLTFPTPADQSEDERRRARELLGAPTEPSRKTVRDLYATHKAAWDADPTLFRDHSEMSATALELARRQSLLQPIEGDASGLDVGIERPEQRSSAGEAANQFYAGHVTDLGDMVGAGARFIAPEGSALHAWGRRIQDEAELIRRNDPDFAPSLDPKEHPIAGNIASGARMFAQSVWPSLLTGGAARVLGAGPRLSYLIGGVGGAAPAGVQQGVSSFDKVYRAQLDGGATPEQAARVATTAGVGSGLVEWGGETVGNYLGGIGGLALRSIGLGHVAGRSVASLLKDIQTKQAGRDVARAFIKSMLQSYASEIATEMGQQAGEAAIEQGIGGVRGEASPFDQALSVVGPTWGLTTIMAPLGLHGAALDAHRHNVISHALLNGGADPDFRAKATALLAADLKTHDKAAAGKFALQAANDIAAARPVDFKALGAEVGADVQKTGSLTVNPTAEGRDVEGNVTLGQAGEGAVLNGDDLNAFNTRIEGELVPLGLTPAAAQALRETFISSTPESAQAVFDETKRQLMGNSGQPSAVSRQQQKTALETAPVEIDEYAGIPDGYEHTEPMGVKWRLDKKGGEWVRISDGLRAHPEIASELAAQAAADIRRAAAQPAKAIAQDVLADNPAANAAAQAMLENAANGKLPPAVQPLSPDTPSNQQQPNRADTAAPIGSPALVEPPAGKKGAGESISKESGQPSAISRQRVDLSEDANEIFDEARQAGDEMTWKEAQAIAKSNREQNRLNAAGRQNPAEAINAKAPSASEGADYNRKSGWDTPLMTGKERRALFEEIDAPYFTFTGDRNSQEWYDIADKYEKSKRLNVFYKELLAERDAATNNVDRLRAESELRDLEDNLLELSGKPLRHRKPVTEEQQAQYQKHEMSKLPETLAKMDRGDELDSEEAHRAKYFGDRDPETEGYQRNNGKYVKLSSLGKSIAEPVQALETAKAGEVAAAAHEAATSPKNDLPAPTEAQKDAGNYKKGHVTISGLDVSIENPSGSRRRPEWAPLQDHYGYIKRTEGKDGDHVDAFINPKNPESETVFVVNQKNPKTGAFDEHKVMLGYHGEAEALAAYFRNYQKNWRGLDSVVPMTMEQFKEWLKTGDTKKPASPVSKSDLPREETVPGAASKAAPAHSLEKVNAKAQSTAEGAKVKEPWEMTKAEYRDFQFKKLPKRTQQAISSGAKGFINTDRLHEQFDVNHKKNVAWAVEDGKPVPPEVLAEYPNLTKQDATDKPKSVGKFIADAIRQRNKEADDYRRKAKAERTAGRKEMAQRYEGMAADLMSIGAGDFEKDVKANPDYYLNSNVDPFLRFKNKETNRETPEKSVATAKAIKIKPEPDLTEAERKVETEINQHAAQHADELYDEYRKRFGDVLDADNIAELFPQYTADRPGLGRAVRGAAKALADRFFDRMLLDADPAKNTVVFTAGGAASGKTTLAKEVIGGRPLAFIYDSTFSEYNRASELIKRVLKNKRSAVVVYVATPLKDALTRMVARAKESGHNGRAVPLNNFINTHQGAPSVLAQLAEKYKGDPRVEVLLHERTAAGKQEINLTDLAAKGYLLPREQIEPAARAAWENLKHEQEIPEHIIAAVERTRKGVGSRTGAGSPQGGGADSSAVRPSASQIPEGIKSSSPEDTEPLEAPAAQMAPANPPPPKAPAMAVSEVPADNVPPRPTPETAPPEKGSTWKSVVAFSKAALNGEKSAQQIKDQFKFLLANESAIKADMLRTMDGMEQFKRRKTATKQKIADNTFEAMLDKLAHTSDEAISWMPMQETKRQAVERIVNGLTDDQVQKQASARKAERAAREKALTNPETLNEWHSYVAHHGEEKLTPEQRRAYDELRAAAGMASRAEQKIEVAGTVGQVEGAKDVGMAIVERMHSKRGHNVFIVTLDAKVDGATFKELAQKARRLGGNYTRAWKPTNSPAGFTFNDKSAAEQFMALREGSVNKVADVKAEHEESSAAAAERLQAMANGMSARADEEMSRERKTNTNRRANMADQSIAQAANEAALAKTIANIAAAVKNGTAKFLAGIRAKTQIETLDGILRQAKAYRSNATGESHEAYSKRPASIEDVDSARFPVYDVIREHVESAAKQAANPSQGSKQKKAWPMLAQRLRRLLINQTGARVVVPDALGEEIAAKLPDTAWVFDATRQAQRRLRAMNLTNDAELRSALREYLTVKGVKPVENPVAKLRRALAGTKIPGYFPTPPDLVRRMLDRAGINSGDTVLEPSAGDGQIADAIRAREPGASLGVVEFNSTLRDVLAAGQHNIVGDDFLEHQAKYDKIVMNPPFENGQDIEHVRHAYDLLQPGGKLVAIMSEGPFFRNDKQAVDFRAWLDEVGGSSEKNPDGSFEDASMVRTTGVATRLVEIEKPVPARAQPEKTKQPEPPRAVKPDKTEDPAVAFEQAAVLQHAINLVETQYARRYGRDSLDQLATAAKDLKHEQYIDLVARVLRAEEINGRKPSDYYDADDLVDGFIDEADARQKELAGRGDIFEATDADAGKAEAAVLKHIADHSLASDPAAVAAFERLGLKPENQLGTFDGEHTSAAMVFALADGRARPDVVYMDWSNAADGREQCWLASIQPKDLHKVHWLTPDARLLAEGKFDRVGEKPKANPAAQEVPSVGKTVPPKFQGWDVKKAQAEYARADAAHQQMLKEYQIAKSVAEDYAKENNLLSSRKTRWGTHAVKASAPKGKAEQYQALLKRASELDAKLLDHDQNVLRPTKKALEISRFNAAANNPDFSPLARAVAATELAYLDPNRTDATDIPFEKQMASAAKDMARQLYPDATPDEIATLAPHISGKALQAVLNGKDFTLDDLKPEVAYNHDLQINGTRLARIKDALTAAKLANLNSYVGMDGDLERNLSDAFSADREKILQTTDLTAQQADDFIARIAPAVAEARAKADAEQAAAKAAEEAEEKKRAEFEAQAEHTAEIGRDYPTQWAPPFAGATFPVKLLAKVVGESKTLPILNSVAKRGDTLTGTDIDNTVQTKAPAGLPDGLYGIIGNDTLYPQRDARALEEFPAVPKLENATTFAVTLPRRLMAALKQAVETVGNGKNGYRLTDLLWLRKVNADTLGVFGSTGKLAESNNLLLNAPEMADAPDGWVVAFTPEQVKLLLADPHAEKLIIEAGEKHVRFSNENSTFILRNYSDAVGPLPQWSEVDAKVPPQVSKAELGKPPDTTPAPLKAFEPESIAAKPAKPAEVLRAVMAAKSNIPALNLMQVKKGIGRTTDLDNTVTAPVSGMADGLYVWNKASKAWKPDDQGFTADDFPPDQNLGKAASTLTLKGQQVEQFKRGLQSALAAASSDATRPVLNSVNLKAWTDEKTKASALDLVGTDGRRMHLTRLDGVSGAFDVNLPVTAANLLLKSNGAGPLKIEFYANPPHVVFRDGNVTLSSRPVAGAYPNYRQVIPEQIPTEALVDRVALGNALRDILRYQTEETESVKVTLDGRDANAQTMQLDFATREAGRRRSITIPLSSQSKIAGGVFRAAFNPDFFYDIARAGGSKEIRLGLIDDQSPMLARDDQNGISYVLMPMRISARAEGAARAGNLAMRTGLDRAEYDQTVIEAGIDRTLARVLKADEKNVTIGRLEDAPAWAQLAEASGAGQAARKQFRTEGPEVESARMTNKAGASLTKGKSVRLSSLGPSAIPLDHHQFTVLPRNDTDPFGKGDKFFIDPDGRWVQVIAEHEIAAREMLLLSGVKVNDFEGRHLDAGNTELARRGWSRISENDNMPSGGISGDGIAVDWNLNDTQRRAIIKAARERGIEAVYYPRGSRVPRTLYEPTEDTGARYMRNAETGEIRAVTVGDKTHFFLDRYNNRSELLGDIREEAAHRLINELGGEAWKTIGGRTYGGKWGAIVDEIKRNYGLQPGTEAFNHEVAAKAYRDGLTDAPLWRRFLDAVVGNLRATARKLGMNLKISDAEMRNLVNGLIRQKMERVNAKARSAAEGAEESGHRSAFSEQPEALAASRGAADNSFVGKTLAEVHTQIPVLPLDAGRLLNTRRGNLALLQEAKLLFEKWYGRKVTAADGASVRLQNPRYPTIVQMFQHLVFNNKTKAPDTGKSAWLPMLNHTLENASIRLRDPETNNRLYVARYSDGTLHMVVVTPTGHIEGDAILRGDLVTQFPYGQAGRQAGFRVDWSNVYGRSHENPATTPPTSPIRGSKPEEFQGKDTQSHGDVKPQFARREKQPADVNKEATPPAGSAEPSAAAEKIADNSRRRVAGKEAFDVGKEELNAAIAALLEAGSEPNEAERTKKLMAASRELQRVGRMAERRAGLEGLNEERKYAGKQQLDPANPPSLKRIVGMAWRHGEQGGFLKGMINAGPLHTLLSDALDKRARSLNRRTLSEQVALYHHDLETLERARRAVLATPDLAANILKEVAIGTKDERGLFDFATYKRMLMAKNLSPSDLLSAMRAVISDRATDYYIRDLRRLLDSKDAHKDKIAANVKPDFDSLMDALGPFAGGLQALRDAESRVAHLRETNATSETISNAQEKVDRLAQAFVDAFGDSDLKKQFADKILVQNPDNLDEKIPLSKAMPDASAVDIIAALHDEAARIIAASNTAKDAVIEDNRVAIETLAADAHSEMQHGAEVMHGSGAGEAQRLTRAWFGRYADAHKGIQELLLYLTGKARSVMSFVLLENPRLGETRKLSILHDEHQRLKRELSRLKVSNTDVWRWRSKKQTYRFRVPAGMREGVPQFHERELVLTDAAAMGFWNLLKNEDILGLLDRSGVKAWNDKGKPHDEFMVFFGNEHGEEARAAFKEILRQRLTNQQRAVADYLFVRANDPQRRALMNEQSRREFGIDLFTMFDRWKLDVDRAGSPLSSAQEEMQMLQAGGLRATMDTGSTNRRIKHRNPLLIRDVFDTFEEDLDWAASYIHMRQPVLNAISLLRFNDRSAVSIRANIESRIGKQPFQFFLKQIGRAAGYVRTERVGFDRMLGRLAGNMAVGVLWGRASSVANNRVGGSALMMSELARVAGPGAAAAYLARMVAVPPGSARLLKSYRDAVATLLAKSGYLSVRWAEHYRATVGNFLDGTEASEGQSVAAQGWRWFQELGLKPMEWAEQRNAADAYLVLRSRGFNEADAVKIVEEITRNTQNTSSALDESQFSQAIKESRSLWFVLPFFSQVAVSGRLFQRDVLTLLSAKTAKEKAKAAKDLSYTLSGLSISAAATAAIYGLFRAAQRGEKWPPEDEKTALDQVWQAAGNMLDNVAPGSGRALDMAMSAAERGGYRDPSIIGRVLDSGISGARKLLKAEEKTLDDDKFRDGVMRVADALGMLAGLPFSGPMQSVKAVAGMAGHPLVSNTGTSSESGTVLRSTFTPPPRMAIPRPPVYRPTAYRYPVPPRPRYGLIHE